MTILAGCYVNRAEHKGIRAWRKGVLAGRKGIRAGCKISRAGRSSLRKCLAGTLTV